ncbi:MAG: endonuclease NucS [Nanoarchaeota archaeon]|nr:endonuclease NucS [Nanoarchaeota archaeon]
MAGKQTDYISQIEKAISSSQTLVIGCSCEVRYSGRAESHLPLGDRIILIKEDKTLLIHQPTGSTPVNYMKQDTSHSLITKGKSILLKSQNSALKEFMEILIKEVHFMHSAALKDGQKIHLEGTEKDMADMIMRNPGLIEDGLRIVKQEEQTKYGFVDVLAYDKENNLVVIECKRYKGSLADVTQLRRYVEKIKKSRGLGNVRGVLAANGITFNSKKMLEDWGFEYKQVTPPKHLERFNSRQRNLFDY